MYTGIALKAFGGAGLISTRNAFFAPERFLFFYAFETNMTQLPMRFIHGQALFWFSTSLFVVCV